MESEGSTTAQRASDKRGKQGEGVTRHVPNPSVGSPADPKGPCYWIGSDDAPSLMAQMRLRVKMYNTPSRTTGVL